MMKKAVTLFATALLTLSLCGKTTPLKGFEYGNATAPEGTEWNNPEKLAYNKEQPHAWFFSFKDTEEARKVLPENSSYLLSLDGTWKFHWAPNPDERPAKFFEEGFSTDAWDEVTVPMSWNMSGVGKDRSLKYGVPIYVNQPVIFQHKVAVDDWKGGVMRTPPEHWTTYKYRNEVGSYKRTFTVPADWKGREIFISFDGVDAFFYLWINGRYVGFSKNSRNAARFDITRFLKEGENNVSVEVYRNSDASFLEAQDMFRLPGIFRSVALYSVPQVHIKDLKVIPDLDQNYENGSLNIEAEVINVSKKAVKNYYIDYSLYANRLYSDDNIPVENISAKTDLIQLDKQCEATTKTSLYVVKPNLWSAEAPNRYTLVAQLKDKKGKVIETVSTIVGFRKVEIKDTPASNDEFGLAGRYYYLNGKTIKLKGVNRHETNPERGHAITRIQMKEEVFLMKRANINHVRNSHYPDDPYWYYLCNKYGIYLEDEANIESHEYYYGDASLSHPKEWLNAHVARVMEMVHSNVNNPCIVIWSLGNEAGPGHNFVAAYDSLKKFDTSRPVQYERNNNIVDMGSNQYPSISWVREAVKGKYNIKYPFHISEYAHSMGNAVGNLIDYWKAIESTNFFCGGAIWDWIDQAMYYYTDKGERFMAYGGDFGDRPNDGQFVMNGIIFANLEPKPQYYEVKKVYQNIQVDAVDMTKGEISVFNKQYFEDLSNYDAKWSLYCNGKEVKNGLVNVGTLAPREKRTVKVPYDYSKLKADKEYFLKIEFQLKKNTEWASAGYTQAEEQLLVKTCGERPDIHTLVKSEAALKAVKENDLTTITGKNFTVQFSNATGTIHSLSYYGNTIIPAGCGPKIDAFRAPVNNDNWVYQPWFENGLYQLRQQASGSQVITNKDGSVSLAFPVVAQAPYGGRLQDTGATFNRYQIKENKEKTFGENDFMFMGNLLWTVYADGSIELQSTITSNRQSLILPRLGYVMELPKSFGQLTYYGRGPIGNYPDRKTGQNIEIHQNKIASEINIWPKPQDTGNHEDVRWCAVTDGSGNGAVFVAPVTLSVQALPNSALDMTTAGHPYELPNRPNNYLHLDAGVTGLGGNSCGQGGPLEHDRIKAKEHRIAFMIRPARSGQDFSEVAHVSVKGQAPLLITRSADGNVEIKAAHADSDLRYRIDKGKNQTYTAPFTLLEAGTVTAWDATNPALTYSVTFKKLEAIPVTVKYASSEETGGSEGLASHLTDNNPNTYWHTMYSVTVAKFPHWVDFDAGTTKTIKGFTYLPRQDSWNGCIKGYKIQISQDGQNWGEPICTGEFPRSMKEQKIELKQTVKARYVRFTALNAHDGQDFATGAEFQILAE